MRWKRLADPPEVLGKATNLKYRLSPGGDTTQPSPNGTPAKRMRPTESREMHKGKRYYYDSDSCAFVELELSTKERVFKYTAFALLALFLASLFTLGLDRLFNTPQELALRGENEALRQHLTTVNSRMDNIQQELTILAQSDQELYRELLQLEPISSDVRQVGVGGADPYEEFSAFSRQTADLLKESSQTIDQLERQIALQTVSYSQLSIVAEEHKRQLEEIPAILPADGPVVSGYGMRRHPILKIVRPHRGVDILVHEGSDVVTPGDGIVKEVGRGGGLGRYVRISHPSVGYVSTFAHLSDVPDGIKRGRRVKRGDVVGFSGNTGLSKAPHLHYEVRDESGKSYNPIYFFAPSMTPAQYEKLLAESQKGEVSLD